MAFEASWPPDVSAESQEAVLPLLNTEPPAVTHFGPLQRQQVSALGQVSSTRNA